MAQRELVRRKVGRLRAQHAHVLAARRRADRRRAAVAGLRYRLRRYKRDGLAGPNSAAAIAVRAALTRLGCPYVWGATGPDRFDCSGLVQWAYAQAGVALPRTTYDQIHVGIPVSRSDVQPGDLVFPHTGHVQLAIGDNLVIEAPYSGASVRISPLGANVAIRRP
jgi:cell wall-associated NlpC family hydrolase